jgi:hypothetical protein
LSARILLLDIETAPIIAAVWQPYEANAVYIIRDTYILSFAAKWLGERGVKTHTLPDYPRYRSHRHDDKSLVRELWNYLDSADIVVAHNGVRFDMPKIRARMVVHDLPPPSHYRTIDTLQIARTCKFDSAKLDNLGRYLGEGRKIPNTGGTLWKEVCEDGNPKAWETMRRYNAQDVRLLERIYNRLKPWATAHPNLNLYHDDPLACPTCQSHRIKAKGYVYLKSTVKRRYFCLSCDAQWQGETVRNATTSIRQTNPSPSNRRRAAATRPGRPAHARTAKNKREKATARTKARA